MELRCLFWGKQTKNWITQCLLPLLIGSTTHAGQLHSPVVELQWKTVQIFRRGSAKFCVRKYRHSKLMSNLRWFYHLGEFKSGTSLHQDTGTETVFSLKVEKVVLRYIPIYPVKIQIKECKCFQIISDLRLALRYVTMHSQILILWMFFNILGNISRILFVFSFSQIKRKLWIQLSHRPADYI